MKFFNLNLILLLIILLYTCSLFDIKLENEDAKYFGLLFGISLYNDSTINDLKFADIDAIDLGGILKENYDYVEIITNENATKLEISNKIILLSKIIKNNDIFLFLFSGHGSLVGSNYYIIPSDAIYGDITTYINNDDLSYWLNKIKSSKKILLFDNCYSYINVSNSVIITGGNSNELTWEYSTLNHGIFMYTIIKGITNKMADINKDNIVTVSELYYYIKPIIEKYTSNNTPNKSFVQHPYFIGDENIEIVFIDYKKTNGGYLWV